MKLIVNGLTKFIIGILIMGALIFAPAGSFKFAGGWAFLSLISMLITVTGTVLAVKAPKLLEKRLNVNEKETTQKGVVAFSALAFLASFVVSGLDFRFGWTNMPSAVSFFACFVFVGSYGLYAEVLRENEYLSRTVEVQKGQRVIDTGLYGMVRHPMYLATILLFVSIPLILGSVWAFLIMLFYPVAIVVRIINEEKVLTEQLEGYADYKSKVKYRLIPFVW